jgi:hypothetical protein
MDALDSKGVVDELSSVVVTVHVLYTYFSFILRYLSSPAEKKGDYSYFDMQ